jgi:hypothetical protein
LTGLRILFHSGMMNRLISHCSLCSLAAGLIALMTAGSTVAQKAEPTPVDGQFPPPAALGGTWKPLLTGKLSDQWTGMSMALDSKLISTRPDPDQPGGYILHIDRGPTGLIRSLDAFENFILEMEWRHLTEAPSANGGKDTSGNSGLLIAHGAVPSIGGPYPTEGHEVQVCHLGNGSWYTSHGDLFTLPGTASQAIPDPRFGASYSCGQRSMPTTYRAKPTGEWNQVRITCVDGVLQQEVNGALVTSLYRLSPRKGYMSFESEGAPVEFRRMRLLELKPDPDLASRHVAPIFSKRMVGTYVTARTARPLPSDDFSATVDVKEPMDLKKLISGWPNVSWPVEPFKGRITLEASGGTMTLTAGKFAKLSAAQPAAAPVLHLDAGKFGHVLIHTPESVQR